MLETGLEPAALPPVSAAYRMKNLLYTYKDYFQSAFIIGGFDKENNKGELFRVEVSGAILTGEKIYFGGSGGPFTASYAEERFRDDFEEEQAVEFLKGCIRTAVKFDASSGGVIRMVVMSGEGCKEIIVSEYD